MLLRLLRDHPGAVEHDLSRYHQVDLRDLWASPRRLTFRQVIVRLRFLPETAATQVVQRGTDWTREHQLLDQIRMQTAASGGTPVDKLQPHPASPLAAAKAAEDDELRAARERAKERHAQRAARQNPPRDQEVT